MTRLQKRRRLASWLTTLLGWNSQRKAKPARTIHAEPLERRELMAADAFLSLLGSAPRLDGSGLTAVPLVNSPDSRLSGEGESRLIGEGEPADDLVAFAKALAATTTKFYGADWCPFCNEQKALFQDGAQYLPFVEVTNANRTPNAVATQNNITTYPTWVFPDGSRLTGVQTLATIAQKAGVAIPKSESVYIAELANKTVFTGSPLNVPLDGYSPTGRPITYTVTSSNPNIIAASISDPNNRSLRVTTEGYGDMVFELFEDKAPRPAGRVIQLANQNFYDGLLFHRVVAGFVIQGGDPQGTGSGGSSLGNFDDQFNLDLQHNQSGVLSFAKSTDDTNNSQFFVTDTATRFLDFNHSIFGQLVEGDSVRKGIDRVPVNSSSKPSFNVTMSDVSVFNDTENGVLVLKTVGSATGTSTITVTATDDQGRQFTRTFVATAAADTSNGAPFLDDIPTLQATAGQALTYTLTSKDKEGNAPTYSVTKIGSTDYTLNVNAQTGVVSLTPPAGFAGTLQFRATVQQSVTTTTNDTTDSQLVTVNVGSSSTLTLTLASTSDTGESNSDRLTNASSLIFNVAGTTQGATVEILDGTTVVGTATASSSTTQVTVNSSSMSGNKQFTARQTFNSQTATSAALALNIDRTAPVQVSGNAIPFSVKTGTALSLDLNHPEEGPGLAYSVTNAPAGLTINSSTGVVSWTPNDAQLGAQTFNLVLTDDAGNTTTQAVTLNVIKDPKLKIRLNVVSATGTPITSVQAGQQFKVQVLLSDLRSGTAARGAFSAYADLFFDSSIISPIATNPINFIAPYTGSTSGTVRTGVIQSLGALGSISQTGPDERVLAEVTFTALATGNANLKLDPVDPPDDLFNETSLYGDAGKLANNLIEYGTASVSVGTNFQLANDVLNFNEDAAQQTLNVLSNDTAGSGVTLTIVEVSAASLNGTVSIASGGQSINYKPAANATGAETFTYTVANAQGARQTATVTVQLTDVNDPPVATNDSFTATQDSALNTLDVLANDTKGVDQASTETLTVTQVGTGSAGGTITVGTSGLNVRYTPKTGFTGTETFTYTISDGRGGTSVGTASVLVNPAVPPPTVQNESFPVVEDAAVASFDVLLNDTPKTAGNALTISEVRPSTNGSTATIVGNKLNYKPGANFSGTEAIVYTVREANGGQATGTVTFTVSAVNDAPVGVADTLSALSTNATSSFNVLENDTDPDTGDTLTISAVTQPTPTGSGTLAISSDSKTITYTPPSSTFQGTFTFTYTVRDAAGSTATGTATVNVDSFTPRDITGLVEYDGLNSFKFASVPIMLSGTTASGTAVNLNATTNTAGAFSFNNLAPGEYMLRRDPLPFLNDQGQQVAIRSSTTDGDFSTKLAVSASLLPQHIDVRDFLGSTFRKSLTAVVKSDGTTQWIAPEGDWANLSSINFQINTSDIKITAANATASNLTATVPLNNTLLSRTTSGSSQLLRFRGATTNFKLAAPTTNSSSSTTTPSGEGEGSAGSATTTSLNSSSQSNSPSGLVGEGEGSASPLVTSGSSTTLPSSTTGNTSTPASKHDQLLSFLLGSNRSQQGQSSTGSVSSSAQSTDEAMKDVLPTLQRSVSNQLLDTLASSKAGSK